MSNSTLRNLGIVLFALVAILVGLELADRPASVSAGGQLFVDLRSRINDIERLTIERAGEDPVVIAAGDGTWKVDNRSGYPADVSKIREVLLALADARILEQKTANPERYDALGVGDPEVEGSEGVRLTAAGGDVSYAVIIGNANQGSNRYVRVAGEAASVLIDSNPSLPESVSGWLDQSIVDIPGTDVREATVTHADGETLRVRKEAREDVDFTVPDIPEGRDLSYPSVANSIGGALNDLSLEDVRPVTGSAADVTVEFQTFDGLGITVSAYTGNGDAWLSLAAEPLPEDTVSAPSPGDDSGADGDQSDPAAEAEEDRPDPGSEAERINAKVSGWEFRVPSFKANQFTRRWDDILKTVGDEE